MEIINVDKAMVQIERNEELKTMFLQNHLRHVDEDIFKEKEASGYKVCYYMGKVDYDTFGTMVVHKALFLK